MAIQTHRCPEPSCSFFNQVLPHNANICPMCGTSLAQAVQPPPAMVASAARYAQTSAPLPQFSSTINNQERPQLKLLHPSEQSFLLLRESGVIGRQNLSNGMRPEIDLTGLPHAGIVSRTHAHLYWDLARQAYMIVDDSLNGSYLNDKLLPRGAPHPLSHGDKLQLGQERLICLQVELNHTSI
ncbi:FHA domain-containing protein [Nostoc sp.]|uniref:FHA domain-containing protein n=1 Tax=Nostoc sp. TaxID=1180 RepID=UPI002FF448E9